MKLNSASPSILMSLIAVASLLGHFNSSRSAVNVRAPAPQALQLRASRLRRRPELELQIGTLRTTATHT
jgi:hypothetical protein